MLNIYTSIRDSLLSVATLPRYSVVEGTPMEGDVAIEVSSVSVPEASESESLDGVVLPDYFGPVRPSSLSPRYTTVFGIQEGSSSSSSGNTEATVSPSVSRSQKEHDFHLKSGKKAWASLNILSYAASSTNAPKFYGGDDIVGCFSLDLDSTIYVQWIKLTIIGRIITSRDDDDSFTFLDESATLWSKTMGDPRLAMAPDQISDQKFHGRLIGRYSWPFSFKFPTEATLSSGGGPTAPHYVLQMPQSFRENETSATLKYNLILHINRGKLRADQRIQTPVIYVPKIVPEPASVPRQLAYRDNSPLPGPGNDPGGWFALPVAVIHGEMYGRHDIPVECSLFLARPLCYTRGTVIPCSLTIKCVDSQVLDQLSTPRAPNVRLQRRIKYFQGNVRQAARLRESTISAFQHDVEETRITTAKWWLPPKDTLVGGDERRIEGELHLPKDLQPSSDFVHFIVEYSVDLLEFNCPAFVQAQRPEVLVSQPVTIATFFAPGPTPRAYTTRQLPVSQGSTFEKVAIELMPTFTV